MWKRRGQKRALFPPLSLCLSFFSVLSFFTHTANTHCAHARAHTQAGVTVTPPPHTHTHKHTPSRSKIRSDRYVFSAMSDTGECDFELFKSLTMFVRSSNFSCAVSSPVLPCPPLSSGLHGLCSPLTAASCLRCGTWPTEPPNSLSPNDLAQVKKVCRHVVGDFFCTVCVLLCLWSFVPTVVLVPLRAPDSVPAAPLAGAPAKLPLPWLRV